MAFDIVGARKSGVPDSVIADHLANQRGFDIAGARKSGVPDSAVIDWMQNNPQDSSTTIERNVAPVVNAVAKLGQASVGLMDLGTKGLDVAADYLTDGKVRIPTVTEGIKRTTGFDIDEQMGKSEEAKNALIGSERRRQAENVNKAFDESLLSGAVSLKDNPDYVLTALEEQIPNIVTMPLALRNGVAKIFTAAGGGEAGAAAVKAALPTIAKKSAVLEGAMTAGSAAGEKSSDGLSNTETASALAQGAATTIGSLVANKLGAKYLGSGDLESKLATRGLSDVIESGEGIVNRSIAAGRAALKSGAENALEEGLQNPLEQIPKSIEDGDTFGNYLDKAGRGAVEGIVVGGLSGGAAAGGASLLSDDSSRSKVSPDNKPVSDGNNPNMDMADLAMQEEDLRNELPRVNPENNVEPEVDANNKNHMEQDVVDPVRADEDAKIIADAELRADADNASRKAKLLKLAADAEEKIYAKKYADGFANEEEKRGYVDRLVLAKRLAMEAKNRLDNLNTVIQKTTKNVDDGNVVDENKTNNQTQEQPIPPAYNDEVSAKDDVIGQGRAAGVLGYQSGAPRQLPESLTNADPSVKRAWYHGWDTENANNNKQTEPVSKTNEQMQNRDREKAASQIQLTGIVNDPDYDRISQSKSASFGAPMAYMKDDQWDTLPTVGHEETVTGSDGRKIKARYAVVEADSLQASNNVDGSVVPEYNTELAPGVLRALNNGRSAGLKEAYKRGTAGQYREALANDADKLGVDRKAIEGMQSPVLIRVYKESDNVGDMGAWSNQREGLELSPAEKAKTDSRMLGNLDDIVLNDDGDFDPKGNVNLIQRFMKTLPANDASGLTTSKGEPITHLVVDRLRNAMLVSAYGDDNLLTSATETNEDSKNLIRALNGAAARFASIPKNDPIGVKGLVVRSAQMFKKAKYEGTTVEQLGRQVDLTGGFTAEEEAVAQYIEKNIRTPNRISMALKLLAEYAQRVEDTSGSMFGDDLPATKDAAFAFANQRLKQEYGDEAGQFSTAGSAKSEPVRASAQEGANAGGSGGDRSGGGETFNLESYTNEEIAQREDAAKAAAEAEASADRETENKAKADAEVGQFSLTGSDRPADVAAAAGQNDMFGAISPRQKTETTENNNTQPTNLLQAAEESSASSEPTKEQKPEEPDIQAARDLIERYTKSVGNKLAEGKIRKEMLALAGKTNPEEQPATAMALDMLSTRLGYDGDMGWMQSSGSDVETGKKNVLAEAKASRQANDKIADTLKKAKAAGVKDIKKLKKTMLAKHPVDGRVPEQYSGSKTPAKTSTVSPSSSPEEGQVSQRKTLEPGDVFVTLSGRHTTPFPKYSLKPSAGQSTKDNKKILAWLKENAIAEAQARNDKFNLLQFEGLNINNWSTADGYSVNLYMFGDEHGELAPFRVKEGDDGNVALFSRNAEKNGDISDQVADDIITLYKELGSDESVFQYDKAVMDTIDDTVFSVLPDGSKQEADDLTLEMAKEEAKDRGQPEVVDVRKYVIPTVENVTGRDNKPILDRDGNPQMQNMKRGAYVYTNVLGEMWVDLSELKKAGGTGGKIYSKVADFAHENGLTFTGDPLGLSDDALIKRTEHMASGIARRKRTSQFAPHPRQVSPYVKDPKDSSELTRSVRPLKWVKGGDRFNQREIIKTAYHNITKIMPELRHAWIDIDDGRIYQAGSPIDTPFEDWVRDLQEGKFSKDGQRREDSAGGLAGQRAPLDTFRHLFASASIKRQLLANTLARHAGESAEKRRQVLDRLGAILPDLESLDDRKVFYQRSSDNGYKRGLSDGKEQTFASGLPRNLPVAETTASRTLESKLNGWRERQGLSGRVRIREISPVSLPKQLNRALAGFTDATGTRVVLFRNLTPEVDDFNGVNFRDGVLYINENSQSPITLTAAHEWVHNLKKTNPSAYQELENEVRRQGRLDAWHERNIKEEGFDRGRDHAIEELTAAAVSDALTDPVFLQKLAERDQSAFRRIAKDFLKFLKTLIDGWKDQGSNEYLQDVEAFRDKLARVLDELPVAKQKPGVIKALFLRVFHGSPHRGIEKEGFKLNKIGSGEGSHNYVIWNEDLLTPEAAKIEPMYSREQSTKAPHEKQRASGKLDNVKEAIVRTKLAAKTKATLNKWVKKERGLTESDYAAYREGQGELHTINGILVPRLTSKMKKAWKAEYGTDNIMQDVRKAYELKKYLDGDKNAKLPDSIKHVADMMRAEIDLKSAQIVDIISDDIQHLSTIMDTDALDAANSFLNLSKSVSNSSMSREDSNKILSEAAKKAINSVDGSAQKSFISDFIAKSQQIDSILANKGKYMNRSYQAHNDPDWMSKIIDDRYSSAGDDYKKNIVNHKVYDMAAKDILKGNPQATDKEIYTAIRQILQDASDVSNPMAAFGSSALIKKMGIFKGRKLDDMAGIRNLLGEYNNPAFAFANTMAKQTNIIASHKFLKGVRDNGLESGLFSTKQEGNYQREITGKGMSPLSGLYTTEQYYNTINDVLHKDKPESYISALLHVSALIKAGKTVLSPGTSILNFLSNASNAMSLGHWSPKAVAKTAKFFVDYSRGDKDAEALMDEAGRLGVISGSLFSHEVAKYIKEHHDVLANEKENIKRFMKPARMYVDAMTWFYEFGDNAWKINAYFNEIENGVGKTKAADIVANGYPNYSTVPKTVDMLKTVPFISDFPSFVWEQYRVSAHQLKWIADEYKDGNKAKALSAATRFIIARGLLPAAAYAISSANGWDYDEGEEYQQRMMAPWDKNGSFIFMPKDGKGNVSAFNIGRYSMYDTQVKVIKAIVAGEPVQAVKEALSGLASFEMWVDALYAAATGKTSSGALIYSDSDTAGDKVKKGSEFLWTQLAPTVLSKNARDFTQSNADLINHTLEGTPLASMGVSGNAKGRNYSNKASALQLIGVRNQNMNASSGLKNKIIQNSITLKSNQKTVRDLLGSQSYINNAQVADVVLDYLKQYDRANNRISEDARYLISSGVAEKNVVFEALKSANVSKENAARIVTGSPVRWKPSKDMVEYIKDQIFNSDLPADKKREYLSQRIKVMNQTINNHYAGKSK